MAESTVQPDQGNRRFQFSIRRLLLLTAVFAALLGVGRWSWLGIQKHLVAVTLTPKDDLSHYVGRRVKFNCYNDRNHGVLYLGDQVIVCGCPQQSMLPKQVETIEGVLVVYNGYARDWIAERRPAKYALENPDGLDFFVKVVAVAFLFVDPLLIWVLRCLRKHRTWYAGFWTPLMTLLLVGMSYGIFLLKTHQFQVYTGFISICPGAMQAFAATVCFGYLGVGFLFAWPHREWKRPLADIIFVFTTAFCIAAGVFIRAWYMSIT
jgi:hypothetical protein